MCERASARRCAAATSRSRRAFFLFLRARSSSRRTKWRCSHAIIAVRIPAASSHNHSIFPFFGAPRAIALVEIGRERARFGSKSGSKCVFGRERGDKFHFLVNPSGKSTRNSILVGAKFPKGIQIAGSQARLARPGQRRHVLGGVCSESGKFWLNLARKLREISCSPARSVRLRKLLSVEPQPSSEEPKSRTRKREATQFSASLFKIHTYEFITSTAW